MERDIKAFLSYLATEKNYSPNTLAAYHNDLEQLGDHLKSEGLSSIRNSSGISAELLAGYMRILREKKYAVSTIARKVAAAKSFFKFMVDRGELSGDISPQLASRQVRKPVPKPLTVSEVRRFLAEPAKSSATDARRDRAMLELLYASGLRASELMALNIDDIDTSAGTVRCFGRDERVRVVPVDGQIMEIIVNYIQEVRPKLLNRERESALFLNQRGERLTRQGFWQIIQLYADKVNLSKKVTPRSLRHSYAAHKLSGGADLQSVQQLLGHAHISTTKAYRDIKLQ
jgi:integrase/recombinase XerD